MLYKQLNAHAGPRGRRFCSSPQRSCSSSCRMRARTASPRRQPPPTLNPLAYVHVASIVLVTCITKRMLLSFLLAALPSTPPCP
jgi:hypothetical protein